MTNRTVDAFGEFELDRQRFELRQLGVTVPIEPRAFDVLAYLIDHRDRVVGKAELLDRIWGDRFVTDSALTTRLKAVRRAVGDDGATQRVIKTVHGRGYQFVAPLDSVAAPAAAPPPHRRPSRSATATRPTEPASPTPPWVPDRRW